MSSPPTTPPPISATASEPTGDGARSSSGHASDQALVAGVLAGLPQSIDRFIERMGCVPRILAAKNRQLGSPLQSGELEDVVQETLVALWRKLGTYNRTASLETWAYRFCFFELLKTLRSKRLRPELLEEIRPSSRPEPSEVLDTAWSEQEHIERGLHELPVDEADLVRLKHYEELTFDEIGRRLDISANTAKTRYYRGIRKLRTVFGRMTKQHPKGKGA